MDQVLGGTSALLSSTGKDHGADPDGLLLGYQQQRGQRQSPLSLSLPPEMRHSFFPETEEETRDEIDSSLSSHYSKQEDDDEDGFGRSTILLHRDSIENDNDDNNNSNNYPHDMDNEENVLHDHDPRRFP